LKKPVRAKCDARITVALKMLTSSSSTQWAISDIARQAGYDKSGLFRTSAAQTNRSHAHGIAAANPLKKPRLA
jgi:hypothetical protein